MVTGKLFNKTTNLLVLKKKSLDFYKDRCSFRTHKLSNEICRSLLVEGHLLAAVTLRFKLVISQLGVKAFGNCNVISVQKIVILHLT